MASIPITGKIISIEVSDDAPFGFAEYSDPSSGAKTLIEPTGNRLSIIELSHDNSNSGVGFTLSDEFNIGDVVEAYSNDINQYSIYLNSNGNNNGIASVDSIRRSVRMRKIFSETGYDWVALKGD